jgi:hypothetical protein
LGELMTKVPARVLVLHDISQLYSLDVDALVEYYDRWGPSVRTCFDLALGNLSLEAMELKATRAAIKFAKNELPFPDDSDFLDVSNILFSIHPMTISRENMQVMIATDYMLDTVLAQVTRLDTAQQSEFFSAISGHPWLKSPLGNFYEKLMHVRLTTDLTAAPLMCTSTMEDPIPMPVVPNVVSLSGSSNLKNANQNNLPFYWRPVSPTFTSLDAIICTPKNIFLLQTTVSPTHSLKVRGLTFIRQHIPTRFWTERQCCLVFVTPDQARGTRLSSKEYSALKSFPELKVFSCVSPVGTSTFTSLQLEKLRKLGVRISVYFIVPLLI